MSDEMSNAEVRKIVKTTKIRKKLPSKLMSERKDQVLTSLPTQLIPILNQIMSLFSLVNIPKPMNIQVTLVFVII